MVFFQQRDILKRGRLMLSPCKSNNSDDANQEPPPPEGDISKQELLARIAMIQTQKVRLTEYLDERSAYLTQFAEEANAEIDQIGETALKELDEASARILENIESIMQAFEESKELNRLEIEESEKQVADFEGKIEEDRNEGMFFKSWKKKTTIDKEKAQKEADKIRKLAKINAGSVVRRNIYLALVGLVVVGIAEASISSTADWKKIAVLAVILVGLLSQIITNCTKLIAAFVFYQSKLTLRALDDHLSIIFKNLQRGIDILQKRDA